MIRVKEGCQFSFDVKPGIRIFASRPGSKGNYYTNFVMLLYGKNKAALEKTDLQEFCKQVQSYVITHLSAVSHEYEFSVEYSGYLIFINKLPTKLT